jgi:hypothetical protein
MALFVDPAGNMLGQTRETLAIDQSLLANWLEKTHIHP